MNRHVKDTAGLRRREALLALGGAGASAAWLLARGTPRVSQAVAAQANASAACVFVLTPEVTEGPYYIANHLRRRNITEGQPGLALRLRLTVQQVTGCKPIHGANVELWHANAVGVYSGYGSSSGSPGGPGGGPGGGHATPTDNRTFLRGHQVTDANGLAVFDTIYPGWYRGRTPHIHLKVHVGGKVVHTGQLFFDDSVSDAVYRTAAYKSHGQPDTTDARDSIYHQAGGSSARLKLVRDAATQGYVGAITLGVKR